MQKNPITQRTLIRRHQVLEITGFSDSTLRRRIKSGLFPKPSSSTGGRLNLWLSDDIDHWFDQIAVERSLEAQA
ncbi:AlpA family phage regulatory protein [Neptunomonas phycophila]|uniref:helix-turn-helix transcriptional regulator n=1 Tax=Neptunomonas phycophila TaxID=1572645 RepID=UPI0026E3A442|nr:AlpA family phage regulatory protein [Neptunomonas phycophila]MDO6785778.1 AlpA family phage regulatory protein [Neptunomonas phycophila]